MSERSYSIPARACSERGLDLGAGTLCGHAMRARCAGKLCGRAGRARWAGTLCGHAVRARCAGTLYGHAVRARYAGALSGHAGRARCAGTLGGHAGGRAGISRASEQGGRMRATSTREVQNGWGTPLTLIRDCGALRMSMYKFRVTARVKY